MKTISGYMLHCEICARREGDEMRDDYHTRLGEAIKLHLPLKGSMFGSPDSIRKLPAPFPRAESWQHMKCPRCSRLPWVFSEADLDSYIKQGGPDRVFTDEGWIDLKEESVDEDQVP